MCKKPRTGSVLLLLGVVVSLSAPAGKGASAPENPLKDYIRKVDPDVFNETLEPEQRANPKPVRGGEIRIRLPGDPNQLNPITENGQQARTIFGYLSDGLISRDPETFEWVPWIADWWEIRDVVDSADGVRLEGLIVEDATDCVRFARGSGKRTFGKHDLDQLDVEAGTLTTKSGETFRGVITEYEYTVEIVREATAAVAEIEAERIGTYEDILAGETRTRRAVKPNVVFIFHLRDGVNWHDGVPLSVEDVIFSYETIRNEYVDCAPLRNYYQDVESVSALDEKTVRFVYRKPYFLGFSICGGIEIVPKHVFQPERFVDDPEGFGKEFNGHSYGQNPVGTGPYKFVLWDRNQRIVVERNPDYWACKAGFPYFEPERPYLDRITWLMINDKNAALRELMNGAIDADFDIEPDTWFNDLTQTEDFRKRFVRARTVVPQYTYIGWNHDRVFFKDARVRNALTLLIPRERILKEIHHSLGRVVSGGFYINGPVYDHSLEPLPYDPKKARRLLAQAGWVDRDKDGIIENRDGVPFDFEYMIHNMRDYHQRVADIVKESIEQAGIKVTIRRLDWTIFLKTVSDRKFDAVRLAWGASLDPDPFQIWHSSQAENKGSNHVGYRNKRVDEICETAREEFDPARRWALLRELHHIQHEEQPYTFCFCFDSLMFYSSRFRNVKLYPIGVGYNLTEWYTESE